MRALDSAIATYEARWGITQGATEILPVCETALALSTLGEMARASARLRCALLGAEDLAADLCTIRAREAGELDDARRRFLRQCRAAAIEPVDAPYTFNDAEGAVVEACRSRGLGCRTKSLVRTEHVAAVQAAVMPSDQDLAPSPRDRHRL